MHGAVGFSFLSPNKKGEHAMHAWHILQQRLRAGCAHMHLKRLHALLACVAAALQARRLTITDLGRALPGQAYPKHSIKRVDRLAGNPHLHQERAGVYGVLARWLLAAGGRPVIVVDWSELTRDRCQLLRAALPVGGRTLTLYEEVHPLRRLGNPRVHRRFLARLKALLPDNVVPIIVTDAGFRSPWFDAVSRLGWHWIGRIRNKEHVRAHNSDTWIPAKTLYPGANPHPRALGRHELARSKATPCALFIVKHPPKHRVLKGARGQPRKSTQDLARARMNSEPWLLASSPSLAALRPREIVNIYAQRMQIEEAFRDLKCARYGLGFELHLSRQPQRIAVLLLIATLALLVLWLVGTAALAAGLHRRFQSNCCKRPVLSVFSLGSLVLRHSLYRSPPPLPRGLAITENFTLAHL
jgi:hypothetical protein